MSELEPIGIAMDTSGIEAGTRALDKLAETGPKVDASLKVVETAAAKTGKTLASLGAGAGDGLNDASKKVEQAATTIVNSVNKVGQAGSKLASDYSGLSEQMSQVTASLTASEQKFLDSLQSEFAQLGMNRSEIERYIAKQAGFSSTAREQAAAIGAKIDAWHREEDAAKAAAAAQDRLAAQQSAYLQSLKQQADTLGFTRKQLAEYQAAQLGIGKEAQPFIDKLHNTEQAIKGTGVSAGQTANALRQLPAQLQDFFIQIQGGQSVVTAFAQQGSQVATSFGGVGNALRAIGSLISPAVLGFGAIAVSVLALGTAFYKGSQEVKDYEKALIQTGYQAGVTGQQIDEAARSLEKFGITQGKAGEALTQLSTVGKVGADRLKEYTQAAIDLERSGGTAIAEFAKNLADLEKAPLQAARRIDEATNFLTYDLLKQIKALEDQGRKTDAARIAQDAYAASSRAMTVDLENNLGLIEKTWRAIGDTARGAWDKMLDIGRGPSLIDKLKAELENIKNTAGIFGVSGGAAAQGGFQTAGDRTGADAARKAADQQKLNELKKAFNQYTEITNGLLSQEEQRQQRVSAIAVAGQKLVNEGKLKQADLDRQIAIINQQYDSGAAQAAIARIEQQRNEETKRAINSINTLRATGYIREQQAISETTRLELAAISDRRSAIQAEISLASKRQNSEKELVALSTQLAAIGQEYITREAKGRDDLTISIDKQRKAIEALLEAQRQEGRDEAAAAYVADDQARTRGRLAVLDYAKAIDEQNQFTQLELSLLGQTSQAREIALAKLRIELDLKKQLDAVDRNLSFDESQREEERARLRVAAAKANADAETRVYLDQWKRTSDQIEQSITDALLRGFESGKGFAQNLRDTLVNIFKTMVLRPVIQATVQPVSNSISSSIGSLLGMPSIGSSAGTAGGAGSGGIGGLGGLGSLFGLGGGASSFTSAFSGGTALGGDAIGAGFTALFSGSGTLAGNFGQILGGANGALSSIGGLGGALGYGSSLYSLSQGKYGAAAGSAIGTFLGGPIGAAIGGSIGGAIDKAFGSVGAKQSGASYLSNGTTGQAVNGGMFGLDRAWGDSIGKYFSQGVQDALKTSTTVGAGLLNSVSTAFGGMGGYQVGAFFASDNTRASQGNRSILGPNGQILSSWSGSGLDKDPTKGLEQLTNALAGDVRTALQQINIPGWAKSQLQALTGDVSFEQLANVVQSILATKEAFKSLGDAMPQLKDLTDSAVEGLLKAFEGLDNLKGAASSYYENFYSQAERNAEATRQLGDAIGALGLQVPSTREAYRSLVEAQDLNTESGRAAYAQLLKLSPAFAALVPATEAAVDSVQALAAKMAEAGKQALAQLADQTAGLQVDLLNAQGDAVGAAALKRQQELAKITNGISSTDAAAAVAAYDYNTQLQDQIDKLKAAAAAAAQRYSLESTLLSLQGNTAALRERELAALDESSRAIQQEIYQLQDQQEAAQKAADAMQAFKSALDGLGETRFNLENQLLALQGDAASVAARVRDRELAKLTQGMSAEDAKKIAAAYDYNVALQAQIDATKAAQQQAQEYAAAQQRAADASQKAAQQIADAWKSAANSVLDEVARIRNQVSGDSPTSFSQAQAKFAITLAQASAGDLDAFKMLPQLSQSMLSIGEQQAVSFADLQSLRTRTAASLEALANRLGFTASTSSFTGGAASAATAYTPAPLQASTFSAQAQSTQDDLLAEIKLLREQVVELRKQVDVSNTNTGRAAEALEGNQSVPILVEMA